MLVSDVEEPIGIELTGGTINRPVLIGDTVRRRCGSGAEAIHSLLLHLESVGFPYSPRFLGIDGQGREILSYLRGTSIMRPWPSKYRSLEGIKDAARVVRLYHEAVASFRPSKGSVWFNGRTELLPGEIIIHGDLGPWNMIVDETGSVVGIIDWDFARPGSAISDISYFAFYAAVLRRDQIAASAGFVRPPNRRERLEAIAKAYGTDPILLATEGLRFELEQLYRIRLLGPTGIEPWAGFLNRGMVDDIQQDLDWLHLNLPGLLLPDTEHTADG